MDDYDYITDNRMKELPIFKEGDIAVCIDNNDGRFNITIDKHYVIDYIDNDGYILIVSDNGEKAYFLPERFITLDVNREKVLTLLL